MALVTKRPCLGRDSAGIVLPITLILVLVLAISGTSMLQVAGRAGHSSSGYIAHLESFYRAEQALNATESALIDLVSHCPEAADVCPGYDSWIKISSRSESDDGQSRDNIDWRNHPHSSAATGSIEYAVEFVDQGSFDDTPGQRHNIYRVRVRAGGATYAAYSSLISTIAVCVPKEFEHKAGCDLRSFRGSWKISIN